MKKLNQRNGTRLRKMLVLTLAVVSIAGMLPMENVQALRHIAVLREEIEIKDWSETEEEEVTQETQVLEFEEREEVKEPLEELVQATEPTAVSGEEIFSEEPSFENPIKETLFQEPLTEEASFQEPSSKSTLFQEPFSEKALLEEASTEELSIEELSTEEPSSEKPLDQNIFHINEAEIEKNIDFILSVDKEGIYDYRTDYHTSPYLYIEIDKSLSDIYIENSTINEKLIFYIASTNKTVVEADASKKYTLKDGKAPFTIKGIGEAMLTVRVKYNDILFEKDWQIKVKVKKSPLRDEDFVICMLDDENKETEQFTNFECWQKYLAEHNNWVRNKVKIRLTKTGEKYYERLMVWDGEKNEEEIFFQDTENVQTIKNCYFWAENDTTRATAYAADFFSMGIDTTVPAIDTFIPDDNYYTPTSTESHQYFPNSFVLKGSYSDIHSKIAAIEYTTNMNAENEVIWKTLEEFENAPSKADFTLVLENGIYDAIAMRAIDRAGNVSEPTCLKNETDEFIKVVVDNTPPEIEILAVSDAVVYSAENENWTNKEIQFTISEKTSKDSNGNLSKLSFNECHGKLYCVEYAYQSIASALCGETIKADEWHALAIDEDGKAHLSIGGDSENPVNRNGYYYFRGVSKTGVSNPSYVEKRVLLWQKMAAKKSIVQTNADMDQCHNEWYNEASDSPILNFEYPKYDTGVTSGEYAPPITIHYNLSVKDEKDITTSIVEDKTANIRAEVPESISTNNSFTGFTTVSDDLSNLQITFPKDGIYTLNYWITDAAGNKSETDFLTYKIDKNAPTDLKLTLADEEQPLGSERTLLFDKFYQEKISGQASADYGISGKESIKILKAKQIGDWKNLPLNEDAEQFQIEPNMRCLLYIRATDSAGNTTEGWTRGVVVDNEAPTGDGMPEMIIEPKGANKHGFFNKDVKVTVSVQDSPTDQNSAALKLVTETINVNGVDHILDKELFVSKEESVSEDMITQSQNFTFAETIDAQANEGNHVLITVNAVDRSENKSTYTKELKIDVTKPEIEITFDNENAINGKYYNADRRAKIKITELNFDPALVKVSATKDRVDFSPAISEWHSEKNEHYAYIDFTADGDYTFNVKCSDLADNEAEEKAAEPFTIDKTMPRVTITLENNDLQKRYFNETPTAAITIVEHNFKADDVWINMQPVGKIGVWEHNNDTHVIKVQLLSEGINSLSCEYKDLAGNDIAAEDKEKMPLELVIDQTAPVINIAGVENDSANSGEVVPVITVLDTNMNPLGTAITLTTGRGAAVEIASDITADLTEGGFVYTLNGLDAKADDIYYLAVNAVDEAENVSTLTYRFSLNRRGSAYDVTDLAKITKNYYNRFADFEDIKIVEMNVDKVEDLSLYLSHNADIIYGERGSRPLFVNENALPSSVRYRVEQSGNEDTGYIYTYTIYREAFALEGVYRLGIYSRDRAGNEVNNLLRLNGEEIQFVIDNTLPRVVIEGVDNNEIYDVTSQEVRIAADDNFKLASAELTLVNNNNEVLERWNYFDLIEKEGDTAVITIGEHKEELSLLYCATDAAGNEVRALQGEKTTKTDFLVTTDKLVQLVNKPAKTSIGRAILVIPVFLGIGLTGMCVFVGRKRKGKNIR